MSDKPPVILVAEDDKSVRLVVQQALARQGYNVQSSGNAAGLWKLIESGRGDVLITDVALPDGDALDLLPRIKERRPDLPVIVMSARSTLLTAVKTQQIGVFEYLPKPFELRSLIEVTDRALKTNDNTLAPTAHAKIEEGGPIIGRSRPMQDVFKAMARVVNTDLTVLISGDSGTGKELVARALHDLGSRRDHPFVAVNLAALPHEFVESELFGRSMTLSADTASVPPKFQPGKFEMSEGGTLFLDEIGDMPIDAQTRLLRVLQEGEFTPIGGKEKILADTRIIAATHKNLSSLIEKGEFREDLFYRLNVVPINIPPLRERKEDIPELVNHFLEKAKTLKLEPKKFNTESFQILEKYQWPGNVRELENFILKLCALYADEIIMNEDLVKEIKNLQKLDQQMLDTDSQFSIILENYLSKNINKINTEYQGDVYNYFVTELEKVLLFEVLKNKNGNQLKAAELLGLNRNTLRKKITELNISID